MHCITNDNLDKWINIIIRCNVMELDLEYLPERFELFSCTTLVILKLNLLEYDDGAERVHCFAALELPESVYLPRLKSLHLESLMFRRTEFMEKLFLSCPVLETLVIINCELDRRYGVVICSGQLKHLEIERLYAYSYCNGKITVSAPNLETLRCKVDVLNEYGMENLSALVKADIGMEERYIKVLSKVWKRKYAKEMIKFLGALSNAKFLSLSALLLEVVPEAIGSMPTPFSALRQLKLKMWLSRDCIRGIKYLLEKSYNLETLPVEITTRCCSKRLMYPYCNATNVDTTKIWEYWKTNMVLQCNFYNLRFVEVWNVHGYVNELEFLKLLLKNAIALEKLIIFTCKSYSRDSQRPLRRFSELLLAFPRASSGAAILLL